MANVYLENLGYCNVCRAATKFVARDPWLRDHYLCPRCGTIPRQRALLEVLEMTRHEWRSLEIHESSPSIQYLRRHALRYSCSFLFPDVTPGERDPSGTLCQDLERLTFADRAFDIFVTQDVLEHVFHPDRVISEIMRVLRKGGQHVFTTPKHNNILKSYPRAQLLGGTVQHLLEPVYHGNPVGDGQSLVTWDYGTDLENLLTKWSGYCTSTYVIRDRSRGLDGEFLEVFVTTKTPANYLGPSA